VRGSLRFFAPAVVAAVAFVAGCASSPGGISKAVAPSNHVATAKADDHKKPKNWADLVAPRAPAERTYFPQAPDRRGMEQSLAIDLDDIPVSQLSNLPPTNVTPPYSIAANAKPPPGIEIKPAAANADSYYGYGYAPFKSYEIRAVSYLFAEVRVAQQAQVVLPDGGSLVYCGQQQYDGGYYGYHVVPVHVEGIQRNGSDLTYSMADGWLDSDTCRLQMGEPTTTTLGEIIPGLLYGYRSCSRAGRPDVFTSVSSGPDPFPDRVDTCTDPDKVNFVFPRAAAEASTMGKPNPGQPNVGSISHATLPLRQGLGEAVTASIAAADLEKWWDALHVPGAAPARAPNDMIVVSVEMLQASEDARPSALVFLGGAPQAAQALKIRRRSVVRD
jgi:hypothetical protein